MAGGGLKGSQKVRGGATGSNAGMTSKPVVGSTVRNARGRSVGGTKTGGTVTGSVARANNRPAARRKGVTY